MSKTINLLILKYLNIKIMMKLLLIYNKKFKNKKQKNNL